MPRIRPITRVRIRVRIRVLALVVASLTAPFAGLLADPFAASAEATVAPATTETTVPITDDTFVYDLDKDPSECIGFLPRPGCGKEPEQAGDRGGALQYVVMAIMLAGIGVIGSVLVRNVIKRDRAMAARMNDQVD